jgi:hypothetical protein
VAMGEKGGVEDGSCPVACVFWRKMNPFFSKQAMMGRGKAGHVNGPETTQRQGLPLFFCFSFLFAESNCSQLKKNV